MCPLINTPSTPTVPGNDNKYAHIPEADIPLSECLKDTVRRPSLGALAPVGPRP